MNSTELSIGSEEVFVLLSHICGAISIPFNLSVLLLIIRDTDVRNQHYRKYLSFMQIISLTFDTLSHIYAPIVMLHTGLLYSNSNLSKAFELFFFTEVVFAYFLCVYYRRGVAEKNFRISVLNTIFEIVEMETERPQLYFFLLPFSIVSLFIYCQILFEFYRKRGRVVYDSFFFRMTCSQSLYDISYVIMYFVMELPQDWPSLYGFFFSMNGTIIPQLIYAHVFMCTLAQILGITMMAISRMLLVCHPSLTITKILKRMSLIQVVFFHCLIPAMYACYIILGHGWRYYGYLDGRISRNGNTASITINSYVLMVLGLAGSISSAVCYIRIFLTLRKRPMRTWRSEVYILATSFVLFSALCTISAFFVANVIIRTAWRFSMTYYVLRNQSYAFTFLLSLSNPWCLMISSASMRSSVLRRCLPLCCARLPLFRSLYTQSNSTATTSTITKTVTSAALPVISVTKI